MITTMDNNQLHYLMRIKQEDIKKMILETLSTFKASRDSKKKQVCCLQVLQSQKWQLESV